MTPLPPAKTADRLAGLTAEEVLGRWPVVRPFVVVGMTAIVLGGLVAAVSRPANFGVGSWVAAFLVLVGGVAQLALGAGQAWLAAEPPSVGVRRVELVTWNLGGVATIGGTGVAAPILTTVGGVLLVPAAVLFWRAVQPARPAAAGRALLLYRVLVGLVAASIAVGLVLSWTRHS